MSYLPGDILLVDDYAGNSDLIGNLIRAGERARDGRTDYARWTHVALIVNSNGDLVEALADGIQRTNVSKYAGFDTLVISPPYINGTDPRRQFAVAFAESQVGTSYDYLDFVMLAMSVLTGVHLSLHTNKRFICSGLVSRATECYTGNGYDLPYEQMMPGDIADYWHAVSGEPLPTASFIGRALDKIQHIFSPFHHGIKPIVA